MGLLRKLLFLCMLCIIGYRIFSYVKKISHSEPTIALSSTKKLRITCTTSIITDVVQRIVGDNSMVFGLMGPGVDPHLYRAKEHDMHLIAYADIVFYHGLHLEGKMADILKKMSKTKSTIAVTGNIPKNLLRIPDNETMSDPHIWFDVQLWLLVVDEIINVLTKHDPIHAHLYIQRGNEYRNELIELDFYIKTKIATIPKDKRILITAHDAFGYFGKAYNFTVLGLQGISTESEAGTRDIIDLARYIIDKKVTTIFVETSIPQRTLQAVQNAVEAAGWHVAIGDQLYSDALGEPDSCAGTYTGMVRYNVDTIVKALSPKNML